MVDPYGILLNRKEFQGIRPNEHSLKVNYVLQNPKRFNSFLFSNSKGGMLHVNQLNTSESMWYNMTYSLGTPEEFYHDILLFLKNDVSVKNLIIGLDEGVIYERASAHENQASRKFVNLQEDKIQWEYWLLPISLKKIVGIDLEKKHMVHDIYSDGNYYAKNAYETGCENEEQITMLNIPNAEDKSPLDFSSQLDILSKIKSLCMEKNIAFTFMVHPSSFENYLNSTERRVQFGLLLDKLEREGFELFRPFEKKLLGLNSCYWLDRHHYSKNIGDQILKKYTNNWDVDSCEK